MTQTAEQNTNLVAVKLTSSAAPKPHLRIHAPSGWVWHGFVATILLAIAAIHLAVLTRNGEPSGLDFGNWLTIGHHILGQGAPGGSQSVYPPVVPVLAVGFVALFGLPWGPALVAAAAGLVPAVAVYWILFRCRARLSAIALAVLIAAAGSTGEAVAWGGAPQLIGLGTGLLATWYAAATLRWARPGDAWRAGGALLATAATSHLELAQTTLAIAVVAILHFGVARKGVSLTGPWFGGRGHLLLIARAIVPSLVLAPLYVTLTESVGQSFTQSVTTVSRASLFFSNLDNLFNDAPTWWKAATIIAVITPFATWRRRSHPLWVVTTALLVSTVAATAYTGQLRLAYVFPLAIACGLGLLTSTASTMIPNRARLVPILVLCSVVATASYAGLRYFSIQRTFYGERMVPVGTTQALTWLRSHTPRDAVIAVAPEYGSPFGWWVEGFTRRPTLTGSLDEFLNFPDERRRAQLAVALFSMTDSSPSQFVAAARDLNVDYLYVPTAWRGLQGTALQRLVSQRPDCVVFRNPAAEIVKVSR